MLNNSAPTPHETTMAAVCSVTSTA